MHPDTATLFARMHAQTLRDEADEARLAARLRSRGTKAVGTSAGSPNAGGTPAWRRLLGWAVIDAGVWLAGGPVEPTGGRLDYGA